MAEVLGAPDTRLEFDRVHEAARRELTHIREGLGERWVQRHCPKSPLPHVKRFKKMLSAAGSVASLDIDVEFRLQGDVTKMPPIPLDATKGHRYADSIAPEIVPVTGYLRRGRIVEGELQGKTVKLEVPEDYAAIVEQAAKSDSLARMTLEVYKCTNPCLPDAPLPKIVSVDEILGQAKLKLVV